MIAEADSGDVTELVGAKLAINPLTEGSLSDSSMVSIELLDAWTGGDLHTDA